MICIGIERFKLVNDTYGERTGDKVLQHVADVMRRYSQPNMLFGRFMQDDFYIIKPHQEQYDPECFKGMMQAINEYPIDMEIRIHCGIYPINRTEGSVANICDSAKLAAEANRGRFDTPFSYYDESVRKKIQAEQFILTHMEETLAQKRFQVYYQPKYDLNTELIVGAEALIRWMDPEKGIISPEEFIPIFEKNGFITVLDKYVWETVCQDMAKWREEGYVPFPVSVNVSRVDIYSPTLVDDILNLVAKYKININLLHLEITESAYTDNPEQIIEVVSRFRELGFVIEMDDFGSGHSSLSMLAKMPVDVLKLDMKFVQTEQQNLHGNGIMNFVISLAKWMNLIVLAEGVETSEQIALLRSMDCNYVQGYYYAKPMAVTDFEQLLKSSYVVPVRNERIGATMQDYVHEELEGEKKLAGRVMLIVDDMELNREALASIFYHEYVTVTKNNGQEAWEYLCDHVDQVEVVMLDLMMPVMDGFQLLKLIKNTKATEHIPVVITSQGNTACEITALKLKANDFISKPYKADLIRQRVRHVVPKLKPLITPELNASLDNFVKLEKEQELSANAKIELYLQAMEHHFDIVRLVQPELTTICERASNVPCDNEFCYSIWSKQTRCNNCISMKALRSKGRCCKLEYAHDNLFFVIAEYVPYGETGAVVELVTKLDHKYVDNILEKNLLYLNLDELQHQVDYDPLTGVYNRRYIDRHLKSYIELARKHHKNLGIAMVDIDSFKKLNDTRGHLAGDAALQEIAKVLQSNVALSKGDFVARFGGDEFMVVCRDIPAKVFKQRMEALVQLVAHLEINNKAQERLAVSIGSVNTYEYPTAADKELVKVADERLYKAKRMGKNCLVAE